MGSFGEAFRPTWCCAVGSSLVGKRFVTNPAAMAWAFYNQQFSVIFVSVQGGGGISDRYFGIGVWPSRVAFDSSLTILQFQTPVLGEATDETIRDTVRLS